MLSICVKVQVYGGFVSLVMLYTVMNQLKLGPMVKELVTITVQEAIKLHCMFQGSGQKPHKSPSDSKVHLVSTNYQLTFVL